MSLTLDLQDRFKTLTGAAQHDVCAAATPPAQAAQRERAARYFYPSKVSGGRTVMLLKILLTNRCSGDCGYCANRQERARRYCSFRPEELAALFMDFYRQRRVSGLFLSSAIPDSPNRTMQEMIETVEILRLKHQFKGYIHLKVLPGCSEHLAREACRLASRASINLEAPNPQRLRELSVVKDFQNDLVSRLGLLKEMEDEGLLPDGHTTQFVVGAAGESDAEILGTVRELYHTKGLRRAYFSAFNPISGTPLEGVPAENPWRQHRLYQADFLHRFYGFDLAEIPLDEEGRLALDRDPKMAWAAGHPEFFPLEINRAEREELLRVPGIGVIGVERILKARREASLNSLEQLKKLKVITGRAAPFLLLNGRQTVSTVQGRVRSRTQAKPEQLSLWDEMAQDGTEHSLAGAAG